MRNKYDYVYTTKTKIQNVITDITETTSAIITEHLMLRVYILKITANLFQLLMLGTAILKGVQGPGQSSPCRSFLKTCTRAKKAVTFKIDITGAKL